ncbi:hypothetical protein HK096_005858, partial [Nowakowskiella sp. JEL0078]
PDIRPVDVMWDSFFAASWSPIGLPNANGCLIIAVTLLSRVYIYSSIGPFGTSDWIVIQDLAELIKKFYNFSAEQIQKSPKETLDKLDVKATSWSPKIYLPIKEENNSVIAVGTKNGSVILFSYNVTAEIILEFQAHDSWVSALTWSEWYTYDDKYAAFLVTGSTDGSVYVWEIVMTIQQNNTLIVALPKLSIGDKDNRDPSILALHDDSRKEKPPKLAVMKGCRIWTWFATDFPGVQSEMENSVVIVDLPFAKPSPITKGAAWSMDAQDLNVYTADGKSWIVNFEYGATPNLIEDRSEYISRMIFHGQYNETGEDEEKEDESGNAFEKELMIFGAGGSANGLFETICYT